MDKTLIGQVRLGILQNNIRRTIILIDLVILAVALLIILIGAVLAGKLASLITQPISALAQATYLSQLMQERDQLTKYKEREKIAFDLHDNCAQDLANLIKRLELCERLFKIEPAKAIEELNELKESIRGHLGRARQIIHGLKSPEPEDFILSREIKRYIEDYKRHNQINIKLEISESADKNILTDSSRLIFYIITEALANIKKHAQAKNVELRLDYNELKELTLKIKDDGKGFDVQEAQALASGLGKWGLMSMRKRAASLGGRLEIISAANQGTEILVKIPFNAILYDI